jgi:hypothetical protein
MYCTDLLQNSTWIQVINAIPEFMQLCVQLDQKTPHEAFGNTSFTRSVVKAVHDHLNLFIGNRLKTTTFGEILANIVANGFCCK